MPSIPSAAAAPAQSFEFERLLSNLEAARSFGKQVHRNGVLAQALKLLDSDEGVATLYRAASRFDASGLFGGSDWEQPQALQPALARLSLQRGGSLAALEGLSELRLLAVAEGTAPNPRISSEQARAFLESLLAQNLDLLFPVASEATRESGGATVARVQRLLLFLLDQIGPAGMLGALVQEVEQVLAQRPIMIGRAELLLNAAQRALAGVDNDDAHTGAARRMIAALHGPSELAAGKTPAAYAEALASLDGDALAAEARIFGQAMAATGLVAPHHAVLLKHLSAHAPTLLAQALHLDAIGSVSLDYYSDLINEIIAVVVRPETARCIYGLARMLKRGILFSSPVPPGLRRLLLLPTAPGVDATLRAAAGVDESVPGNVLLVAGTVSVLGQPRGVDQGHNPTCQAARAISMWAHNDVGYLLELIARAALDNALVMHLEGKTLNSATLSAGLAAELHTELDPISLLLTPHLDRLYMEMSRRTAWRGGDGHRWVNPEFHGWWVYRDFAELIDVTTGGLRYCDVFLRTFYAAYHPLYNGGRDLVYVQPCGIAVTDYNAVFVGWHAITIQRVARDPSGEWRVYFFNPNRDKGQNWGQGIVTSTHENAEYEGESSLPFDQFAARLYVFHYKERELGDAFAVPAETVASVRAAIAASWAANRVWHDEA